MNINNKLTTNPSVIANAFNTYFSLVAENLITKSHSEENTTNGKDPLIYLEQNFTQSLLPLRLTSTTIYEINKIIQFLKCKDCYGYDEISPRILKISAPHILSPLIYIINKTLATGIFPDRLKFSVVKPIFKKGAPSELSNYHPISLLTSFSKIIEKIIYIRLYQYLIVNNILVNEQFGFKEKSSTEVATHYLLNTVLASLDKKKICGWPVLRPTKSI